MLGPAWPETNRQDDPAGETAGPVERSEGPAWSDMNVNFREGIPGKGGDGHAVKPVEPQCEEARRTREVLAHGREEAASTGRVHTLPGPSARHQAHGGLPIRNTFFHQAIAVAVQATALEPWRQRTVSTPFLHQNGLILGVRRF